MGKRKTHEEFVQEFNDKNDKAILIGRYIDSATKIKVCCVVDKTHIWEASPSNLLNNSGCPICRKINNLSSKEHFVKRLNTYRNDMTLIGHYKGLSVPTEFKCSVGHIFSDKPNSLLPSKGVLKMCPCCKDIAKDEKHNDFVKRLSEVNDEIVALGYFTGVNNRMEIGCKYNPSHKWSTAPSNVLNGTGCPFCFKESKIYLSGGKQNLWETHPEIAKLLQNPDDGYKYSYGSGVKVNFICPDCGNLITKKILDVTHYGLVCKKCSKNYSYPNKFMSYILDQLGVDYIAEYYDDWTMGKYYDFYFELNNKKYIVEMDGTFHYKNIYNCLQKNIKNDKFKDSLALNNNVDLIRIDCNYDDIRNRFDYIKNNVISSKLNNLFDFSIVNFIECDKNASISTLKQLTQLWNDGLQDLDSLSQILKLRKDAVSKHIKNAAKLGLLCDDLDMATQKIKVNGYKNCAKLTKENNGCKIMCNETGEVYPNISSAVRQYNTKMIYKYFYGECKYAGKLQDGTKLTWSKISEEQYNKIINSRAS